MHRSHTSYVTECLHNAGLYLGDALIEGNEFNQHGHFEDQHIVAFHEKILQSHGLRNKWQGINDKKLSAFHYSSPEVDEAHGHMSRLQENKEDYGWKDPRASLFLPFWHTHFPSNYYLFVIRNPVACVNSLIRRSKINSRFNTHPLLAYALFNYWDLTNQRILEFAKIHANRCELVYAMEDLLAENRTESINEKILNEWGFQLEEIDFSRSYDASLIRSANPPQYLNWIMQSRRSTQIIFQELLSLRKTNS